MEKYIILGKLFILHAIQSLVAVGYFVEYDFLLNLFKKLK